MLQPHDSRTLETLWSTAGRWRGVTRPYSAQEVLDLRPSEWVEHTLAQRGAERLWNSLHEGGYVNNFGALTGAQAV